MFIRNTERCEVFAAVSSLRRRPHLKEMCINGVGLTRLCTNSYDTTEENSDRQMGRLRLTQDHRTQEQSQCSKPCYMWCGTGDSQFHCTKEKEVFEGGVASPVQTCTA